MPLKQSALLCVLIVANRKNLIGCAPAVENIKGALFLLLMLK